MILELKKLNVFRGQYQVLSDLNLKLTEGRRLALLGINGSGKSTLLMAMMGLLKYEGEILLDGKEIRDFDRESLAKKIAWLPQENQNHAKISVFDFVLQGLFPHLGVFAKIKKEDQEKAFFILEKVHASHLVRRMLSELSFGQRRRVVLARALMQETPLLLLDEPTSSLDPFQSLEFFDLMTSFVNEKKTIIFSQHHLDDALRFSDDVAILADGRIQAFGQTKKVINDENLKKYYRVKSSLESGLRLEVSS